MYTYNCFVYNYYERLGAVIEIVLKIFLLLFGRFCFAMTIFVLLWHMLKQLATSVLVNRARIFTYDSP